MLVTRICPDRLNHERAADLLLEIEALARRHGFLLERNLRVNEADEMPSVRIRLIETSADGGAIEPGDRDMIREQIVQALKAVTLFGPPPRLEFPDWTQAVAQMKASAEAMKEAAGLLASLPGYGSKAADNGE